MKIKHGIRFKVGIFYVQKCKVIGAVRLPQFDNFYTSLRFLPNFSHCCLESTWDWQENEDAYRCISSCCCHVDLSVRRQLGDAILKPDPRWLVNAGGLTPLRRAAAASRWHSTQTPIAVASRTYRFRGAARTPSLQPMRIALTGC